jgi:hypothetical protein
MPAPSVNQIKRTVYFLGDKPGEKSPINLVATLLCNIDERLNNADQGDCNHSIIIDYNFHELILHPLHFWPVWLLLRITLL